MSKNKEDIKEPEISEQLTAAFYIFINHFKPALSLSESDEQLSTMDINHALQQLLSPFEVSNSAIYKLMWENNFRYTYDNGFKWMLTIQKNNNHF